jgi:ABC-type Fe3+-siderophore transport system permease subunit
VEFIYTGKIQYLQVINWYCVSIERTTWPFLVYLFVISILRIYFNLMSWNWMLLLSFK